MFPVISNVEEKMADEIFKAKMDDDSIGGIIQTAINNLPVGLGEPWFDSFEGVISNALFSIGGIKGVEFGAGFNFANLLGSTANDSFKYENNKVVTTTNNNGGINGGITNGMPIIFNAAVKPTPSISKLQQSIDFIKQQDSTLELVGRHDPAIIRRICIVVTSLVAIVVCDQLVQRFGQDYLTN
jgi:chorismate synthase